MAEQAKRASGAPPAAKGRKRARRRKWAMSRDERRAVARGRVARVLACLLVLALTLALALVVGTDEYRPSIVGWAPFIAVCTCILVAFAYSRALKRSLRLLEKSSSADCRRNEKVRFTVRLRNLSPLFFFRIEAHFFTADAAGHPTSHASTTLVLSPFERYDLSFDTVFEHIGIYQAGLERVVVYDFLRLFSATVPGPGRVRVQVVPKLVPVTGISFADDAAVETTKAARSAMSDSMDYAAVREYAMGDPMKNVHWKLSARTEGLMTKLFESYTNPGLAVVLDFYGPGANATEQMELFDCVVESGFSTARHAQTRGFDTEIHYVDARGERVCRTTWREQDLPALIADMPQMSSEPARAADALGLIAEQVQSIHGQANIVVCTANLTAPMVESVVSAKIHRREPMVLAAVPKGLEGRERDRWLAPLARLDAAGVPYAVLESADGLSRAGRRRG